MQYTTLCELLTTNFQKRLVNAKHSQYTGISVSNDCDFCAFLIKSISFQSVLISKSKDVCEYKVAANKNTSREKTHQQRAAKIYFVK